MEHADNPVFEITVTNIEQVYNRIKSNKKTDGLVFIKDTDELAKAVTENKVNFILLTDSVTLYFFNAKRGTAAYNSLVNDTRLKHLRISLYNDRNHNDLFELLKDILTMHPNLRCLEITTAHSPSQIRRTFLDKHCALLCEGLKRSRTLKELIIHDSGEINDKMSQMLAEAINENKSLNTIKLRCSLAVRKIILDSLKKNRRIQILQLNGCYKTDSALNAPLLKEFFEENTAIKTLTLVGIIYSNEDVDPLMTFLQTTSSLQTLEFPIYSYRPEGYTYTGPRDSRYLEEILPRFIESTLTRPLATIRTLKLRTLDNEDLNMVLRSLIDNSSLTSLQLGDVTVNDEPFDPEFCSFLTIDENTVEIWNELLTKNKTLKEISLNGLICSKEDRFKFRTFPTWFKHNKTLTKLDLRANNMVHLLFGDALSCNKTLKSFGCSRHLIPDELWQQLLTNKTIVEVDISDFYANRFKDTCLFLQHNTIVQKLVSILDSYEEGDQFLELLAKNTNITSFHNLKSQLGFNSEFSGQKIAMLKDNWILTDFELGPNWYNALYEPILTRNRLFKLHLTLVMHNIARQKPTIFPLEIWRLIFRHLTPDVSILM